MTVIAWDGRTLAADKQTTFGEKKSTTTKIFQLAGGDLAGFAGPTSHGLEMVDWYEEGANKAAFPEHQRDPAKSAVLMVIKSTGHIVIYDASPYCIVIHDKQFAIGSGGAYAMAAMHCGKSALEAVEVACHFDACCGRGIDTLALEG